jgi:hypothetical protein
MFFIFILTFANAVLDNKGFVLTYRYKLGEMPLNVIDGLIALGMLLFCLRWRSRARFHAERISRSYLAILSILLVALLAGILASAGNSNNAALHEVWTGARNHAGLIASICFGYYFLYTPRSGKALAWIYILSGLGAATMILLFFSNRAAELRSYENLNTLRTIEYVSCYAGLASLLLLFTLIGGVRLIPIWLTVVLAALALIGQFATLSRSDWLGTFGGLIALFFLIPREKRMGRLLLTIILVPVLFVTLLLGVYLTSRVSGTDFYGKMVTRLQSMLPGSESGELKAWNTRLPAAFYELKMWMDSPIWGNGFAAQNRAEWSDKSLGGMHHNPMTAALCETGIFGFTAYWMIFVSMFIVGRRLVRARLDPGSMLVGGLACVSAAYFLVFSVSTLSINTLRGAIPLGIVCGAVLRARAMQRTMLHQWEGYLPIAQGAAVDGQPQDLAPLLDFDPAGFAVAGGQVTAAAAPGNPSAWQGQPI